MKFKRIKISLIFFFISLSLVPQVFSHPPSEIRLAYDMESENLSVEILHVTRDPRKHRIRRILIAVNDGEPISLNFSAQTSPTMLKENIPLKASEGDVINVKAICSEAGYKEATITVPGNDL